MSCPIQEGPQPSGDTNLKISAENLKEEEIPGQVCSIATYMPPL